jgi:hypothetical protein
LSEPPIAVLFKARKKAFYGDRWIRSSQ